MISRTLALGLLSTGCVVAAAGGSYLAVRHNAAEATAAPLVQPVAPTSAAVQETEAVVTPRETPPALETSTETLPARSTRVAERATVEAPKARPRAKVPSPKAPVERSPSPAPPEPSATAAGMPASTTEPARTPDPVIPALDPPPAEPITAAEPVFVEIVVPATSVIGLELESTVSSERARVEDRVDARVTRDVYVDGRMAIPAGSRVIGSVTLVERGGKVKERARLGIRFHTLVLAGGRQVDLRTETIYRDGESPVNDSSKKIGGAAVGGAVLGAILGGGKGAIAGATAGAAGGTAAVMAGDRKPAVLTSGSVVTVKLSAPVTLETEK